MGDFAWLEYCRVSERFYIWIEDLLMRLTRGVFSEVAHDPILDASSAPDLLKI